MLYYLMCFYMLSAQLNAVIDRIRWDKLIFSSEKKVRIWKFIAFYDKKSRNLCLVLNIKV